MSASPITVDDLVERVDALLPQVRATAAEGERIRRVPDATIAALRDAGVFRALVPVRYGGLGLGFPVVPELGLRLGAADVSTAWVTTFLVMHNWLLAQFPDEVCREVFAERGEALAPAALSPTGTAVPRPGGYEVSGRWSWASGAMHAEWVLLTVVVGGDAPDLRMVLVPPDEVTIEDVWHVEGMRATGSNDVVAESVFVPSERTVSFLALAEGTAAADNGHADVELGLPLVPTLCFTAAAPLVGGGRGAVDAFTDRMRERVLAYSPGDRQAEQPAAQIRLALADADVRAAGLLIEDGVDRLTRCYLAGSTMDRAERSGFRMAAARAVDLAKQAARSLVDAAGGSAHFVDQPLQRFVRDLGTGSGHMVFDLDRTGVTRGRILAGLEPAPLDML